MKTLRFFTFAVIIVLFLLPTSSTIAKPSRSSSAGDLDPEFGEAGKLIFPLNIAVPGATRLAIQPDGKLLLATTVEDATDSIAILRFLPDGSPDSSFGGDGRIDTSDAERDLHLGALILQPDGKILVVGSALGSGIAMARYLPDGSFDTSFGEGGGAIVTVTYGQGITGSAAGLQPDGKILVAGIVHTEEMINGFDMGVFVARFFPDGSLDPSFGEDGFGIDLFVNSDGDEPFVGVNDMAVLPDGKIVVVGSTGHDADSFDWLIELFNADGSFDARIPGPGVNDCDSCFDAAFAAVVQPDGKLVIGGVRSRTIVEEDGVIFLSNGFAMLRFNPDHSPDKSFGEVGEVYTNFPSSNNDIAYDMTLQQDGKIILAGETRGPSDFALARYHPDGSLDESFGEAGLVTTDFGGSESATAVAIQPDGKIVAAGTRFVRVGDLGVEGSLAVARYFADSDAQPMKVKIDIRPGSLQNTIVLGRLRVIPVAILSTPDFDATQIDKSSLTFGSTGDEQSLIQCTRGVNVNHDRLLDTLCSFRTREAGFQVGDSEGILKGQTRDGIAFEGHDQVTVRQVGSQ